MNEFTKPISLGCTDLQVTPLGIGTWAWGDRRTWGYGRTHTEADLQAAFESSLAAGINLFDTAEIYGGGQSELLLGRFIKAAQQRVVVATKFMPYPWRLRRGNLLRALRQSLDRLGLARVDLYQIHWPFPPRSTETRVDELAKVVESGLVRAAGVSNYSAEQTRRARAVLARHGIVLASNQVEYSLLKRSPERNGVMQTCRELGIALIAYSPIAMGVLSGKYTSQNPPTGMLRGSRFSRKYLARIQPLIGLLRQIGQAHDGRNPAQVALNWVMCKGAVPIPGAKNARQAQENAGALGWRLAENEIASLDAASDRVGTR
jgi:aryl-alcohol dehydrogenase-like predicted oxidoreductase